MQLAINMSSSADAHALNGKMPQRSDSDRWSGFNSKLLSLWHKLETGEHPALKLPSAVFEEFALRHPAARGSISFALTNGTHNDTEPLNAQALNAPAASAKPPVSSASTSQPSSNIHLSSTVDQPCTSKASSMMARPDDPVRAELRSKRLHTERIFQKQQVTARPDQGRYGECLDIDNQTEELALQAVKLISGLATIGNDDNPDNDSFDENSYYSSQAWSSDGGVDRCEATNGTSITATEGSKAKAQEGDAFARQALHPNSLAPTTAAQPKSYGSSSKKVAIHIGADDDDLYSPMNSTLPMREESEDYSPPPAATNGVSTITPIEPSFPRPQNSAKRLPYQSNGGGYHQGNTNHTQAKGPGQRASPGVSRPGLSQDMGLDEFSTNLAQPSPPSPAKGLKNPKKRRRGNDNGERARKVSDKRPAKSPEPYIKPEPVSPTGLTSSLELQPPKRRQLGPPDDVEVIPTHDPRMRPTYMRESDLMPAPQRFDAPEPTLHTAVRSSSQALHRRIERDEPDLRRIASLQYARRPLSPQPQPMPPLDLRSTRAGSHVYVERPPSQRFFYPEGERVSRVRSRSRSPIRAFTPTMMFPPPPREYIVDEYGRKYYAVEESAPLVRHSMHEPFVERTVRRESLARQPVRVLSAYEEEMMHRMLPPAPKRAMEPPEMEYVEQRAYRDRAYSQRPAEILTPMIERRPAPFDAPPSLPTYSGNTRAYSVRPEVFRQEAPIEYLPRHTSVQPRREHIQRAEFPPPPPAQVPIYGAELHPTNDSRMVDNQRYGWEYGRAYERPLARREEEENMGGYEDEPRRVAFRH